MRKMRSSCACAKYHPGLWSIFIHSVVSNDSVGGQWRPWSDARADLGFRGPHFPVFAWRVLIKMRSGYKIEQLRNLKKSFRRIYEQTRPWSAHAYVDVWSNTALFVKTAFYMQRLENGKGKCLIKSAKIGDESGPSFFTVKSSIISVFLWLTFIEMCHENFNNF